MAASKKRNDASCPPATAASSEAVGLRHASSRDSDFLFSIYRETMKDYSAAYIRWDDDAQRVSLANQLSAAEVSIITLHGVDIGWLALLETDGGLFLGHFYVQPQFQSRGFGSTALRRLLAAPAAKGKTVELTVLKNNPARRFYERFGFSVVDEDEMKYFMRRSHGI